MIAKIKKIAYNMLLNGNSKICVAEWLGGVFDQPKAFCERRPAMAAQ